MDCSSTRDLALAGVVHDLNNVFQTIADAADLMAARPEAVEAARVILRAVVQGQAIVSGMMEHQRPAADLDSVVDAAFQFARDYLRAAEAGSTVIVKSFDAEIRIQTPAPELVRVFTNLFINSGRAAAGAGIATCTIRVAAIESDGRIQIRVADDGPGIAPDILPAIFKPGFSSDAHRQGLGLHIVDSIVRHHNGTVWATNGSNGGAEFTIVLPSFATAR